MISPEAVFQSIEVAQGLTARWTVPTELPYFAGHFPGAPILPAIAIVDASTYLLQCALQRSQLRVASIKMAKFHNPVIPGLRIRIDLVQKGAAEWLVEWFEDGTDREFASLTLQV